MMPHYQEKRKRTMLRFNDGVEIDTSGELRLLPEAGVYVDGRVVDVHGERRPVFS